jgi:hypothetical protein
MAVNVSVAEKSVMKGTIFTRVGAHVNDVIKDYTKKKTINTNISVKDVNKYVCYVVCLENIMILRIAAYVDVAEKSLNTVDFIIM